jgi:hypothetical protein
MRKFLLPAATFVLLAWLASPTLASTPGVDAVVATCKSAATTATSTGKPTQTQCTVDATALLNSLKSSTLSKQEQDKVVVDLIYALVPLTQDGVCNDFDNEVAQIVKFASALASDKDQTAQLLQISDTVATCNCDQPDTAAIDTSVTKVDTSNASPGLKTVIESCEHVAGMDEPDGSCIAATQTFLETLKKKPATTSDLDQSASDVVLALVPIAQEKKTCSKFNDEVARAVQVASGYVSTKEQADQFAQISAQIGSCSCNGTTGAINVPIIPTPTPASTTG